MICEDTLLQPEAWKEQLPTRILVVEDDPSQADALAIGLNRVGYEVQVARSGEEAMSLLQAEYFSAIIMDICLPGLDGLSVCQCISDDPRVAETPIVLLSALDSDDIVRRARASGCRYYIRKPYDPNTLLLVVEAALSDADCWQN